MSYEREWDRGKDHDDHDRGGHVRHRDDEDEDYYRGHGGSSKRQKFIDEDYEEYSYDDRRRRKLVHSTPSEHIIFLGLEQDFTEADLQAYLLGLGAVLNSVTIIRDRATGVSKGFGFAEFASIEHASAFLTPRFPFIHVPPAASHGAAAYLAWQRTMDSGSQVNQRRVKIDFSQSVAPGVKPPTTLAQLNDGTRDIGTTAAPVLLFRGLDPISAPEAVAAAMKHSAGPDKDGAKGMRRVALIKDKMSKISWGFAFVEFIDNASATAVFTNAMSQQLHPAGFKISDRPVAVSFAHPYSWQKVPNNVIKDEACIESTAALGGVDGEWTRYWDENSTVAVLEFDVELPSNPQMGPKQDKKKRDPKTQNVDAEVAAFLGEFAQEITAASAMPVSDKPLTLSFNKPLAVTAKPQAQTVPAVAPAFVFASEDADDALDAKVADKAEDPKAAASKRVGPLIASKKVANNISRWTNVQTELNPGGKPADVQPAAVALPAASTPAESKPAPAKKSLSPKPAKSSDETNTTATSSDAQDDLEFSDSKTFACFLCSRALKSVDQLKRHNLESDLHKKNLKDTALRDVARGKAVAAKKKAAEAEAPKYRDRALERRAMHNQPDAPPPEAKSATSKKRAEGPPPPPSPPPPALAPGKDENNVGNKLLKKMGWTDGEGLGTEGEGRVDPIQTAMFESGAGIGASKGKDIGKYASGYGGYLAMAKDSAMTRFNESS